MSNFFNPNNEEDKARRSQCAVAAMDDLEKWISEEDPRIRVAIYDATNSTRSRRAWIANRLKSVISSERKVIFVESVLSNNALIEANIREAKITMPDYMGVDEKTALTDFYERIAHYRSVYAPLDIEYDKVCRFLD